MTCHYTGSELELFAHASHWKKYWASKVIPHLTGAVLEVGAGLGTNAQFLMSEMVSSWTCLEPDPDLFAQMRDRFAAEAGNYRVELGTTEDIRSDSRYNVILYIDVLEHIQKDREELRRASSLLHRGGKIVVLAPAHQWLYTPFDQAIGHYRRYGRPGLLACSPADCRMIRLTFLDSMGILASIGNRFLLRQTKPDLKQILFWDRFLVPASRFVDTLTWQRFGKSILAIWEKL